MSQKNPVNQVRLTNIAVVRHRVNGNRYEIACFPNKVQDWRKKVEKNLMNVMQSESIFKNVSKGQLASSKELAEDFGMTNTQKICQIILEKGVLQVGEKERNVDLANKLKEVVILVSNMCVLKDSGQPLPVRTVETGATQQKFGVKPNVPVKMEALRLFKLLREVLPIDRVKMKVLVTIPVEYLQLVKILMEKYQVKLLATSEVGRKIELTGLIDPGMYRGLHDDIQDLGMSVEIIVLETQSAENEDDIEINLDDVSTSNGGAYIDEEDEEYNEEEEADTIDAFLNTLQSSNAPLMLREEDVDFTTKVIMKQSSSTYTFDTQPVMQNQHYVVEDEDDEDAYVEIGEAKGLLVETNPDDDDELPVLVCDVDMVNAITRQHNKKQGTAATE